MSQHIYCIVQELKTREKIRAGDIRLIEWRTEISNLKTICFHHVKKYLTRYESLQKTWCNPFQTHAKLLQVRMYYILILSNSRKYISKQPLRDVPWTRCSWRIKILEKYISKSSCLNKVAGCDLQLY